MYKRQALDSQPAIKGELIVHFCMNTGRKNSFIRQLRNLHISVTTMCAHTDTTDTGRRMRQELRNDFYSRLRDWIA